MPKRHVIYVLDEHFCFLVFGSKSMVLSAASWQLNAPQFGLPERSCVPGGTCRYYGNGLLATG